MIIEVKDLSIWYKNQSSPLLVDINLKIDKGQTVVITGEMGSGKTSLFWAITKLFSPGALQSASGEVISKLPLVLISQRIKSQILTFNVSEELVTKLSFEKRSRSERLQYIVQISKEYNLDDIINRDMRNLSSGQQQLIIILANLATDSNNSIILLDEPLSLLDSINSKFILSLLNKLTKLGNTIIVADTRPERYSSLNPIYYKLEANKLSKLANIDPFMIVNSDQNRKISYSDRMTGNSIKLNFEIGYSKVIQTINIDVLLKGILLVTGDNGSGKTAFLLTLAKIIKPFQLLSKGFEFPQSIYLPQDTFSFFWKESVEKELEGTFSEGKMPIWVSKLTQLSPFLLSEGQRKKLGLEICFSKNTILLLDEPTQSLDHSTISWFIDKLEKYSRNNLVVVATNDEGLSGLLQGIANVINFKLGD